MNDKDQKLLAKNAVEAIINICMLFGVDYFKMGKDTQKLLSEIYIAGMQNSAKFLFNKREEMKKEAEEKFGGENEKH